MIQTRHNTVPLLLIDLHLDILLTKDALSVYVATLQI